MPRSTPAFVLLLATIALISPARADDWPQWLGPKRDGIWRETNLTSSFPTGGPPIVWRAPVTGGYAGPAIADGCVYVTDYLPATGTTRPADPFARDPSPGAERVHCLKQSDGSEIWSHQYPCTYSISYNAGPRATPLVDEDRLCTLGAEGDLYCYLAKTGKVLWSTKLSGKNSPTPTWGFAACPLIDGNQLICLTADKDANVTAFDKKTGAVLWKALPGISSPGYCPPMIYTIAGVRQLIIWNPDGANGLDPSNGKVLWNQPFGPIDYGVTITTPQFTHDPSLGDVLLVSSQHRGSMLIKLAQDPGGKWNAAPIWQGQGAKNRKTDGLAGLMCTPVIRDSHLYGLNYRGDLRCLDLATGEHVWDTFDLATADRGSHNWSAAFLTPLGDTGDRYLIANEAGDLILASLSPSGCKEISRAHVLTPTNLDAGRPVVWSAPAYANRCVYWRSDKELIAVNLAGK